ncbi:hypothetical protein GCM10027020_33040 [Nocardioides salsibiostraticola]
MELTQVEPRDRIRGWASRSKQAAVAVVLVGSTLFAGPVPTASAVSSPDPVRVMVAAPGAAVSSDAERALGARLAVEYSGAVPAADVESLVRRVSRRLRKDASPPERLLSTAEAICRRALTDYLARGVLLPAA